MTEMPIPPSPTKHAGYWKGKIGEIIKEKLIDITCFKEEVASFTTKEKLTSDELTSLGGLLRGKVELQTEIFTGREPTRPSFLYLVLRG